MAEPSAPLTGGLPAADASPDDFDRHVRRADPDRWLSSRLIAAPAARTAVLALYALDGELAKIAPAVSQPVLGEIRLQWWREALERAAGGGPADHPVIAALKPALQAGRAPREGLEALISSHADDLEMRPFADEAALVAWLDARHGSAMGLAARLLDPAAEGAAVLHAGRAWGWAALLRAPPAWRAEERGLWAAARARERIDQALRVARVELRALPTAAFPAVAHAALARDDARGRGAAPLARRAKLLWAAARGAL